MKKTLISLLLIVALVCTLFAACSKTGSTTGKPEGSTGSEPEEIVNVVVWLADVYAHGADASDRLNAAINKITEPKGIHADVTFLNIGDWLQKAQMSISSNERIDLMTMCVGSGVTTLYTNSMVMDITDLLDQYAPEAKALMEPYIPAYTFGGRVYGLPTYRSYVTNGYVCFYQDALDEIGMTEKAQNLDSWSTFEEILEKLTEANKGSGRYAFCGGTGTLTASPSYTIAGDKFSDIVVNDVLGDSTGLITTDKEGHVSFYQKTNAYVEACKMGKKWMDNGWVFPDSIYDSSLSAQETIGAGGALSEICSSEIGLEAMKNQIYKAPSLCIKLYTGVITTGTLTGWGMGVPVCAEEPEAAVRLMNLFYTNSDLMKLVVNGIEGEDYELVDGQAKQTENMFSQGNFIYGNNLLALPVYGNGADFYDRVETMNKEAECSPYLGFNLDTNDLELYISQIAAVTDQYRCAMASGGYSDDYYNEYISKLEAAGAQDYVNAVQEQLDAWLAAK